MAKNVKINLRDMSDEDLMQKFKDSQDLVKQHAFNHVITPLDNPMKIRQERREVARILTEINHRKRTAQAK